MPELPDDLATRLRALAGEGQVTLPGAAAARRRGAQRTRRTRAGLAGSAAAALGLVAVLGTDLGSSGRDRVSIPAATPAPAQQDASLDAALLDADDLGAVLGGRWTVRPAQDGGTDGSSSPLPADCTAAHAVTGPGAVQRSFGLGGRAEQVLVRHADERAATAALAALREALEQCPQGTPSARLVGGLPGTSETRAYGQRLHPEGTVHFALERVGPVLSAVSAPSLEQLPALADTAAVELRAAGAHEGADEGAADRPEDVDVRTLLLSPADTAQVLPGPWARAELPGAGAGQPLFPCGAPVAPSASGDGRVSAGVRLAVQRETGGTVVRQEVVLHRGPTTAAQAYDLVRERLASCPVAPLPQAQGGGTEVVELVDADVEPQDGVRTLLARVVATCTDCPPSTSWYAVQQAGDVLSTLGVAEAEDGDRGVAVVKPFAALVAQRLRAAA